MKTPRFRRAAAAVPGTNPRLAPNLHHHERFWRIARCGMHGMAVDLPLIRPAADTVLSRLFSKALAKARLDWPARIEVNSLELVHAYVVRGFGSGLSVKAPGIAPPKGTRAWEIPDCPELAIAAAWPGKLTPLAEMVLAGLRQRAKAG